MPVSAVGGQSEVTILDEFEPTKGLIVYDGHRICHFVNFGLQFSHQNISYFL